MLIRLLSMRCFPFGDAVRLHSRPPGVCWILFFSLTTTCSAQGLSLAINGQAVDAAPTLIAEPDGPFSLDLQLVNPGGAPTQFSSAQATILLRPLAEATGEIEVDLATVPSVFGLPPLSINDPTDDAVTVQAAGIRPASLAAGSRASFAQLDLLIPADASGDYELIALEFNPLNLLRSSHWLPPSALGVPPPAPVAFGNTPESPGEGLLLATISVPSVPEPTSVAIGVAAYLGIVLRRCQPLR